LICEKDPEARREAIKQIVKKAEEKRDRRFLRKRYQQMHPTEKAKAIRGLLISKNRFRGIHLSRMATGLRWLRPPQG